MDDIIAFLKAFVAADLAARRAVYAARSDADFDAKVRELDAFYDQRQGPMGFDEIRPPNADPAVLEESLRRVGPRIVFLIRRYRHGEFGDLWRCYVSSGVTGAVTRYFESLFVARTDKGFRVVARWRICLACRGAGESGGQTCAMCAGDGWEPGGGGELGDLGAPVETLRLEAPTDPVNLKDYES
jgi:hypothetical protein